MNDDQSNLIQDMNKENVEANSLIEYKKYYSYKSRINTNKSEEDPNNYSEIYKDKHYICKFCSSFPLIKLIDNNNILLICNNHRDKIEIEEFLKRIKEDKDNIDINKYKQCKIHKNNKILIKVCINCKKNLCEECLKDNTHKDHQIKSFEELNKETIYIQNILKNYIDKNKYHKENKTYSNQTFTKGIPESEKQNSERDLTKKIDSELKEKGENPFKIIYNFRALIHIVLSDLELCQNYIHYENIRYFNSLVGEKLELEYYSYSNDSKLNIRLFGEQFVKNNKNNCSLIINGERKDLIEEYKIPNIDTHLYITLVKENEITDMSYMFYDCDILRTISEKSKWKTEKVTNMSYMFYNCEALRSLPNLISDWNTKDVTDISYMFYGCKSLTEIPDISNWKMDNVKNMSNTFNGCESLKNLTNIYKWNTINVENMYNLFGNCKSLEELNVFPWNTSNVTDMSYMFYNCFSLKKIIDDEENINENIDKDNKYILKTKWNTSKVSNMSNMFNGCEKLQSLPEYISKWDISKVQYMSDMFNNCKSLKELPKNIINWNTSNVFHMNNMFENCVSLEEIPDITNWDISKLVDINNMFEGCDSLKKYPNFSKWNNNNRIVYKEGKLFEKFFNSNKSDDYDY